MVSKNILLSQLFVTEFLIDRLIDPYLLGPTFFSGFDQSRLLWFQVTICRTNLLSSIINHLNHSTNLSNKPKISLVLQVPQRWRLSYSYHSLENCFLLLYIESDSWLHICLRKRKPLSLTRRGCFDWRAKMGPPFLFINSSFLSLLSLFIYILLIKYIN